MSLPLHTLVTSLACRLQTVKKRYATSFDGVLIVDDSSLIHDFYTGECERPVHLVVDTALKVRAEEYAWPQYNE